MSKILIIDDELEICKQVSLILNKNDFNSLYVTSYEEFTNLHKSNFDFDLVLVDLWLKNSSKQGIDIINELKNKNIKVVLKNHNETLIGKIIDVNQDKSHNHLIVFQFQNQIVTFKKKRIRYIDPYLK